ncbi:MAG: DsrE family protein [Trueperaceae bacterium]|nr:DsrE family protein [Trueperaceae bacterium]
MNVLFILNDPPYGTERSYNALRLALQLAKGEGATIRVFLMADGTNCAKQGQETPDGYYNLARMLRILLRKNADVGACGTCMDARGLREDELLDGVHRSTMEELATWTHEADKVLVF